ncbi:hypothetical protein HDU96_008753 [Phlyctochytrium bullatum]|nr:hypothetical protein HDU96_008753 [Phlyctochytrium bullatum]
MQNPFGYFVLLTKIFGKIIEYTNIHKTAGKNGASGNFVSGPLGAPAKMPQGQDPDYQLSILDASLRTWFANIPDWMRNLGNEFTDDLASENPPSFGVAYLHIFYHTCLILLHRPKMMTILRENPKNVQRSPAFSVCHNSASEVTAVIRKVQTVNQDLYYMTAFVAFCIFQSGLIHVMAAQVSSDAQVVENSKRNADLHLSALAGVAKYWFMAGRLHDVLKGLIATSGMMKEAGSMIMSGAAAAESDNARQGIPQMQAGGAAASMAAAAQGNSMNSHLRGSPPVLVQQPGGLRDGSPNHGLPMGLSANMVPNPNVIQGNVPPGVIPVQSPPQRISMGGPSPMMDVANSRGGLPASGANMQSFTAQLQEAGIPLTMPMDLNQMPMGIQGMSMGQMNAQAMFARNGGNNASSGGLQQQMRNSMGPNTSLPQQNPMVPTSFTAQLAGGLPNDPRMPLGGGPGMNPAGPSGRGFGMPNASQPSTDDLLSSYNFLSGNPFTTSPPPPQATAAMMGGQGGPQGGQPRQGQNQQGGPGMMQMPPHHQQFGYGPGGGHAMDAFQLESSLGTSESDLERVLGGPISGNMGSFFKDTIQY